MTVTLPFLACTVGTLFASADVEVDISDHLLDSQPQGSPVAKSVGSWQQWSKQLGDSQAAVLVMNNADSAQEVAVQFNTIPTFAAYEGKELTVSLRDVWHHLDLGEHSDSWSVTLESHDSAFVIVTAVSK